MIKIIGDVHGKFNEYHEIATKTEYTIQLGDFGFSNTWNKLFYSPLFPENHKVIPGNHDDYDMCLESPFCLGDFGTFTLNGVDIFFVRGGLSIDRVYRIGEELNGGKKTWWSQEELSFTQMVKCLELYKKTKPDIVITHAPPTRFIPFIHGNKDDSILAKFKFHDGFKENTSHLGELMLSEHTPKLWISGHHHKSCVHVDGNCKFVGLAELEVYNLE